MIPWPFKAPVGIEVVVGDANTVSLDDSFFGTLIQYPDINGEVNNYKAFDSARGVFVEGEALYPNAGFNEKNHIQICIRNPNCIKGFFYHAVRI